MRNKHSLLQPLAAAALCVLAATTMSAQAPELARTGTRIVNAAAAPVPRLIAIYLFDAPRSSGMPVQVTLADSAGRYTATYKLRGSSVEHAMAFELRDSDIILSGPTPAGTLTLAIRQKDDNETPSNVIGRWSLGRQSGELLQVER